MSDLPVETELIDGAIYVNENGVHAWWVAKRRGFCTALSGCYGTVAGKKWQRLAPVAEYKPAPTEPTGLGAVVRDANGRYWILADMVGGGAPWMRLGSARWRFWDGMDQPVEILSPGVSVDRNQP